jgi:hypothetical protein
MALSFALSYELKDSAAYDYLEGLLEQNDFMTLSGLFCGKEDYNKEVQGELISYKTGYPESNDINIMIRSYDYKVIECNVYNHKNNVKITRRDYSKYPIMEDMHVFCFDYRTGNSSVSNVYRNVYGTKDKERFESIAYNKMVFDYFGGVLEYRDTPKDYSKEMRLSFKKGNTF